MNSGAKYTLIIAASLIGAAMFPPLAFGAGLILVGMGLHSILSTGTTMPPGEYDRLGRDSAKLLSEERRRLDREL